MGRFKGKKKKNYNQHERKNVEEGFIPPEFIDYYHTQFVPDTLSEEDFQIMIETFKEPLSHTFRIVGSSSLSSNSESPSSIDPLRAKLHHDLSKFLEQLQNGDDSANDQNANSNTDNQNDEDQPNQTDKPNDQQKSQDESKDTTNKQKVTIEKVTCLNDMFGEIYKLSADKPTLRRDPSLAPLRNWLNVNMKIGNVVRQELVSMVPPFFLDLKRDSRVLDVAAAPGSKTSQILSFVDQGLVVANDVNVMRSTMLVHNLGRLRNLRNEEVIVSSHPAQYLPLFEYMKNDGKGLKKFDRILCDVPCSGDGTLRKNPDACLKFTLENGAELHQVQRAILIRALKHLDDGGILVYSTCSLNPIEDEAVINSVVLESKNTVEIKDVSDMFPEMKRSHGIKNWKVLSEFRTPTMYSSYDPSIHSVIPTSEKPITKTTSKSSKSAKSDKKESQNDSTKETDNDNNNNNNNDDDDVSHKNKKNESKPKPDFDFDLLSQSESKVVSGIEHCMRFFPHQNNTGGFFVAVLQKKSSTFDTVINEPHLPHKPSFKWRENPYLRLVDVSPSKGELLSKCFGLDADFISNLFVRDEDESLIRNIFYCSPPASGVVMKLAPEELRAVSCGLRVFTWKEFKDENTVRAVPCIEGASVLKRFMNQSNERIVPIGSDDMKMLLRAGNDGCKIDELKNAECLRKLKVGGLLFVLDVKGTNICYGGLLLKDNVLLYVKKDMIDQEIERIDIEIDSLTFVKP